MARAGLKYSTDKLPSSTDIRVQSISGSPRFGISSKRTVQTGEQAGKLKKEIDHCGIDIMGLSEERRSGQGEIMSEYFNL